MPCRGCAKYVFAAAPPSTSEPPRVVGSCSIGASCVGVSRKWRFPTTTLTGPTSACLAAARQRLRSRRRDRRLLDASSAARPARCGRDSRARRGSTLSLGPGRDARPVRPGIDGQLSGRGGRAGRAWFGLVRPSRRSGRSRSSPRRRRRSTLGFTFTGENRSDSRRKPRITSMPSPFDSAVSTACGPVGASRSSSSGRIEKRCVPATVNVTGTRAICAAPLLEQRRRPRGR